MKKGKILCWAICCFLWATVFTSCSEDKDEYLSRLPQFSDITFDTETLYSGQTVTARAVQSTTGKMLEKTDYSWVINDSIKKSQTVVYDKQTDDPFFTFTIPENTQILSISFTAKYRPYGASGCQIPDGTSISGGSISYNGSALVGEATITKTVRVYTQK